MTCLSTRGFTRRTVRYLREHQNFGMAPEQVFVLKQDVVPALVNRNGELAIAPDGHLIKKPHGHGDVHLCLYRVAVSVGINARMGLRGSGWSSSTFAGCSSSRIPTR